MRFVLKVSMPTDEFNARLEDGTAFTLLRSIMEDLKPEAAYFSEEFGLRTAFLVVNIQEPSQITNMAEPWFLAFSATVEFHPAMTAEDLKKAEPRFEEFIRKYI